MTQPRLQDVCEQVVDDVDGVVGCAVVDLGTGLPLALDVKSNSVLSTTAMELLAAAGVGYFGGDQARSPDSGGGNPGNAVEDVQITTEEIYGFMSLPAGTEYELVVLVTARESTNLGLGWMALRKALEMVRHAQGNGAASSLPDGEPAPEDTPPLPGYRRPEYATARPLGRRAVWDRR